MLAFDIGMSPSASGLSALLLIVKLLGSTRTGVKMVAIATPCPPSPPPPPPPPPQAAFSVADCLQQRQAPASQRIWIATAQESVQPVQIYEHRPQNPARSHRPARPSNAELSGILISEFELGFPCWGNTADLPDPLAGGGGSEWPQRAPLTHDRSGPAKTGPA